MPVIAQSVLLSLMTVAWLLRLSPLLSAETDDSLKRALEELASLDDRHQKMLASWRAGLDAEANECTEALNDADFLARMRSNNPYPAEILGSKFVAFAERSPDERVALPALVYVVRHGASENDPESPLWKAREAAITLITERYKDSRSIQILLICVSRSMPSGPSERLLRIVFSQTPHREVKATAGYSLACYLLEKSRFLEEFREAVADDENGEDARRFWRLVTVPYLERQRIGPPATLLAEVKLLLEQIKAEFPDVHEPNYRFEPDTQIRWRREDAREPAYAELADGMLFALEHLNVGCPAPEIVGHDIDGDEFKLSDFRGRVVLLSFSANWCGSCVRMYPLERRLVDSLRGRPFAMLSVNGDPETITLREAIERGDITWRCWWDGGRGGVISTRWHVEGWPTLYVIDAQGIIRHKSHSDRRLEETIEALVDAAESANKP